MGNLFACIATYVITPSNTLNLLSYKKPLFTMEVKAYKHYKTKRICVRKKVICLRAFSFSKESLRAVLNLVVNEYSEMLQEWSLFKCTYYV